VMTAIGRDEQLLERLRKGERDVMQALADNLLEKSDAALVLGTVASRIWLPHGYVATLELRPIASHTCDIGVSQTGKDASGD